MFSKLIWARKGAIAAIIIAFLSVFDLRAQDSTEWSPNISPLPSPTAPVNDYAGVIDEGTKQALNRRLIEFQRSSGVELAVAVVKTTGERPIFDYSLAVYRGWGIGAKEGDNPGALLLVAIDDRKYFTQVSANLEDELPDGLVGSLQKQYLVPEFRKGNYAKGISDTIEAYIRTYEQRSSGSAASPTPVGRGEGSGETSQSLYSLFCCLVVGGVILLIIFSSRGGGSGKGRGHWGGGGFGGSGGALPWIIGSAIANAASSSSDWGSSGSGWSGSSDWGGGGSDWGGFGGGGDASGGGAGGDW